MQQEKKRIVVKIGTSSITTQGGLIDIPQMQNIVEQISLLHTQGYEIILITSGAVGTGKTLATLRHTNDELAQKQVFAAVGQAALIGEYSKLFSTHHVISAQILVTKEDFRDALHRTNVERCLEALLHEQIIPVVNENDTTAVEELMFTDNDELTALVAILTHATQVIILTSIEGVFMNNSLIPMIDRVTIKDIIQSLDTTSSPGGRGGMKNKLRYAEMLLGHNIPVAIAHARTADIIAHVIDKKAVATYIQ